MHDPSTYTETKSTSNKVDVWYQIVGIIVTIALAITMVVAMLKPILQ